MHLLADELQDIWFKPKGVSMFKLYRVTFLFLASSCLHASVWLSASSAAIPNSDNPKAYTEKQYRLDLFENYKAIMSELYDRIGHKDPRWDGTVKELLDAKAALYANSGADDEDKIDVPADRERLSAIMDELEAMGCDDPLVRFIILVRPDKSDSKDPEKVKSVYDAFMPSSYTPHWKISLSADWAGCLEKQGRDAEAEAVWRADADLCYQLMTSPIDDQRQERFAYYTLSIYLKNIPQHLWKDAYDRAAASDSPNRWLIDMVGGTYHIKAGWDARGSGYAYTATDEGWKSFDKHLREAAVLLNRAWQANPTHPESAEEMISVAMGGHEEFGDERAWFERAVQAQFDYYPAYTSYLWSLRPRWGGSYARMYTFGVECLDTGRFDTRVPEVFYKVMNDIAEDDEGYEFWKRPDVYNNYMRYLDGRRDDPDANNGREWWESMKAAVAWRVGRYEDSVNWMRQLGDKFNPRVFLKYDGETVLGPSESYAHVTIPTTVFSEAREAWSNQSFRRASELFEQALSTLDPDDLARPYMRHLSIWAQRQHKDVQGVWVDMLGQPDLYGWRISKGDWSVDGQGRITGVSDKKGLELVCRYNMGHRLEVEGELTLLESPKPIYHNGGVMFSFRPRDTGSGTMHRSVLLYDEYDSVIVAQNYTYDRCGHPVEIHKSNTFKIEMWDEHLRIAVNDQVVCGHHQWQVDMPDELFPFAIGARYVQEGSTIRFNRLLVRRLTSKPAWVDTPHAHQEPEEPAE